MRFKTDNDLFRVCCFCSLVDTTGIPHINDKVAKLGINVATSMLCS